MQILLADTRKMLLNQVQNILVSRTQILLPKQNVYQFSCIRRNNVSAKMFLSLARPLGTQILHCVV